MHKDNDNSDILVLGRKGQNKPPGGSLDILVNNAVHITDYVKEGRKKLYNLRHSIGNHLKRVKPCGRYLIGGENAVSVVNTPGKSVAFHNLQTCASVWSCPVCSTKINYRRSQEVREMLTNAIIDQENKGLFITLTLPHTRSEDLHMLQKTVSNAWRALTADTRYKGQYRNKSKTPSGGLKQRFEVKGFMRALEVKKGGNGWHPHLHICFVLGDSDGVHIQEFAEEMIALWSDIIKKISGKRVSRSAQDYTEIYDINGISDYATKWDLAKELVEANKKEGSGLTPFQLFEEYEKTGNEAFLNEFLLYSIAFTNVKQLTFSKNFKKMFAPGAEEKTDQEISQEEKLSLILSLDKPLFKELHTSRNAANFLNVAQFDSDSIPDFLEYHWPGVYDASPPGSYPFYKLPD